VNQNLEGYLKEAAAYIHSQDSRDQEQHYVELCLLVIQCLEVRFIFVLFWVLRKLKRCISSIFTQILYTKNYSFEVFAWNGCNFLWSMSYNLYSPLTLELFRSKRFSFVIYLPWYYVICFLITKKSRLQITLKWFFYMRFL
jgi:hypothetical protein